MTILRELMETRGLRLTDTTSRAYRLAAEVEPHAEKYDPSDTEIVEAVAIIVGTVAEYEHGSADWPTDPDTYCMVATDLALCILLGSGRV